jgi:tRNA threonylcarbamoyladenosine biosynthesis protein TsaB
MKLLAWDTSSKTGALSAIEWDRQSTAGWAGVRVLAEWSLNVEATHSERLLWAVEQMLKSASWKLEDVDVFAVGLGPGSFTGLRIGVTTARTLAHSLGKPLVGLSSLAALARPAASWAATQGGKTLVAAATDACKGEVFALWGQASSVIDCACRANGDYPGVWKRGVEEQVLTPDGLAKQLRKRLKETKATQWIAIGEGFKRYPDVWPKAKQLTPPSLLSDSVTGRALGQLAWEAVQAGAAESRDPLTVRPRYLRAPDAELKLKRGELPPGPTRGIS